MFRAIFFCASLFFSSLVFASDCGQFHISCKVARGIPAIELMELFIWFCSSLLLFAFSFFIGFKIYDAVNLEKPKKKLKKRFNHKKIKDKEDIEDYEFENEQVFQHERD